MVAEDTDDHRAVFGPDGDAVLYFSDVAEMVQRVFEVRHDSRKCKVLAERAHRALLVLPHPQIS